MDGIIPELRFADKQKLLRRLRKCRDAGLKSRYLIVVNLFTRAPTETAAALHIARSTVYRVAARFRQFGEWGLLDRREDNGASKLSEYVLAELDRLVRDTPQNYGWPRPTWTRELLVATLRQRTGGTVARGDHEPSAGLDPCPAGATAAHGGLSVAGATEKPAVASDPGLAGEAAPAARGGLRRRGGTSTSIPRSAWTGWAMASRRKS